nr:hypothetical protein [Tanacetum cinerariifolium]
MANVNVNAPAGQTPTMASPVHTDDQILPHIRWVPIGKSNCYLDVEKSQSHPIYKIAVDILKHTNFFRAFTASSTIPSIYIQQFWDTITPVNDNQAFTSPPSSNTLINFVNEFGYAKLVRNLSNVVTNNMFQPGSTSSTQDLTLCSTCPMKSLFLDISSSVLREQREVFGMPIPGSLITTDIQEASYYQEYLAKVAKHRQDALQITPVNDNQAFTSPPSSNALINFVNEFGYPKLVRNLSNVVTNNMFQPFFGASSPEPAFGMPIPGSLITTDIQEASYYQEYLAKVAKHRQYLAGETGSDPDSPAPKLTETARKPKPMAPKAYPSPSVSKLISSTQPETTSTLAKPQGKKRKLATEISNKPSKAIKSRHGFVSKKCKPISTLRFVDELVAEDVPTKKPRVDDEEADVQRALEESMKRCMMCLRVHSHQWSSGNLSPRNINRSQRCRERAKKRHDESLSLYVELGLTNSEEESEEAVSNPDEQPEGQAGPDPGKDCA